MVSRGIASASIKGAEIIFLPNAGFHENLAVATCCEQGIYYVSASSNHRQANLIGTPDFRKLASGGGDLLMAEVDLTEPKPYGYKHGQTCGMPEAFRQMPHTINDRCWQEILQLYRTAPSPANQVQP